MSQKAIDRATASKRTRKLMRTNIELLEQRLMLSAHGVAAKEANSGPHGVGLEHAAAPAQINAEQHALKKSGRDDTEVETTPSASPSSASSSGSSSSSSPSPAAVQPASSSTQTPPQTSQSTSSSAEQGSSSGQLSNSSNQSNSSSSNSSSSSSSFDSAPQLTNQITDNLDTDQPTSSGGSHGSTGVVIVEIVLVDPLPTGSGASTNFMPDVLNSTGGNPSSGNGWVVNPGGQTNDTPSSVGQGTGSISGSIGLHNPHSGHPLGGYHHDDDGADGQDPSGGQVQPLVLHPDGSTGRNVGAGQADTPAAVPAIIRNDNPPPAPIPAPLPLAVPQVIRAATQAAQPAPAVLTPLAMTPARDITSRTSTSNSTTTPDVAPVSVTDHDSIPTSVKGTTGESSAPITRLPGQVAAAVSPVFAVMRAITAVPAAARAVTDQITDAVPVVTGANPITAQSIEQSLPAQVAYNFIRFDAAAFHDAVSVFAADLASLTTPSAARHSTTRAWIITGTVLGLDAVFLGYWHQKTRKEKRAKLALARVKSDPRRREDSRQD